MRELSLFVSVVLCLPTLTRARTKETIIPGGSLLERTSEEPNFSSASAKVRDPLICDPRGLQEFGRAVFAGGAYFAGHLAESNEPGPFWANGWLKLEFDRIFLPDTTLPVPGKIVAVHGYRMDRQGKIIGRGHPRRDAIQRMIPPLWPWKIVSLPARGPRPTLKGETEITLRLMDDVEVPLAIAASRPAAGQPEALWAAPWRPPAEWAARQDVGSRPTVAEPVLATSASRHTPTTSPLQLTLLVLKGDAIYGATDYGIEGETPLRAAELRSRRIWISTTWTGTGRYSLTPSAASHSFMGSPARSIENIPPHTWIEGPSG